MTIRVPSGFFERDWDGSGGGRFEPTFEELPSFEEVGVRRTVPPFDLLLSSNWDPVDLAVGPPVEVALMLDATAVGQILASLVIASSTVSVTVGAGVAPDVFIRFGAPALLDVRSGRSAFLRVFQDSDAVLDGDDAVLLYLAGLFDDRLWTGQWATSDADQAAASALLEIARHG